MSNILEQANNIENGRTEEAERQYGDFDTTMDNMRDIFNAMTGLNLDTQHMYKAMIAMKFARERYTHKTDNLLDAAAYIGALDNYIENKRPQEIAKPATAHDAPSYWVGEVKQPV